MCGVIGHMPEHAEKTLREMPLHRMFLKVPPHYDLTNRAMTWGMDMVWRRRAAEECLALQPGKVLDLCCGTGDLVAGVIRMAKTPVEVVGVDYSRPMLDLAVKKARPLVGKELISFVHGDAAALPFPDDYFDCAGISFAFRNLTYKNPLMQRYLEEVLRVLRPGGRFVIVETSQPGSKLIRGLYHFYLRFFAAVVGRLISGNRGAYRYLAESASRFYTPGELEALLVAAGFREISFRPLFLGVVGIHTAVKEEYYG